MKYLGFLLLLMFTAVSAYTGQTIASLAAARDNTLFESTNGSLSDGKGEFIFAGKTATGGLSRRAVLQFDIASVIPKGSTIVSAVLTLHMSKSIAGATPVSIYRLLSDWGEGSSKSSGNGGGGTASTPGDATWMHAFYDTSAWKNPGGDYSNSAGSSLSVAGIGSYSWPSTAALVADVQQWLDVPASNFGWILIGDESAAATAKRFESRENVLTDNRPSLKIAYSAPMAVNGIGKSTESFSLEQNFPNPFNPSTRIRYTIASPGAVRMSVYSLIGQELETLVDARQDAGVHTVEWNAGGYPSGVYFCRLSEGKNVTMRRMVLIR